MHPVVASNLTLRRCAYEPVVQATERRMHGPGGLQLTNNVQLWFRFKQRDLYCIISRHERYDTRKPGDRKYLSQAGRG